MGTQKGFLGIAELFGTYGNYRNPEGLIRNCGNYGDPEGLIRNCGNYGNYEDPEELIRNCRIIQDLRELWETRRAR